VHKRTNSYEKAIEDYNRAIEISPNTSRFYTKRANAYCKLEQYQPAIEDYTKVIRMEPGNAEARFDRAVTYMQTGEYRHAVDDYNTPQKLDRAIRCM